MSRKIGRSVLSFVLAVGSVFLMTACGAGSPAGGAVDGKQTLLDAEDVTVVAQHFSEDNQNRKILQFAVNNAREEPIILWVTSVKLDGTDINFNSPIKPVDSQTEAVLDWMLYSIDLYDYDKDLFPDLQSFELSVAITTEDLKEIAAVDGITLDFKNLVDGE